MNSSNSEETQETTALIGSSIREIFSRQANFQYSHNRSNNVGVNLYKYDEAREYVG